MDFLDSHRRQLYPSPSFLCDTHSKHTSGGFEGRTQSPSLSHRNKHIKYTVPRETVTHTLSLSHESFLSLGRGFSCDVAALDSDSADPGQIVA